VLLPHRASTGLTVDTDLMSPWMTPGVTYHREMGFLVAAGVDPASVLDAATQNGAIALGLESEVGMIRARCWSEMMLVAAERRLAAR